jgi:hypothetical protein
MHTRVRRAAPLVLVPVLLALLASPAGAVPSYDYTTPIFGLAAKGEVLFVADAGAGVVRLGQDSSRLAVALPEVSDVAPTGKGKMWAVTSGGKNKKLWQVVDGDPRLIANLGKFEKTVNPDQGAIDSNPFDLAALGGGRVLVADAAANAVLIADRHGSLDWVATLPNEDAPTANAKQLVGCPSPPPDFTDVCDLPDTIPAEAVTTTVAVGPDGAYYVGELKGFPAPTGLSKIWRIDPGTLHADCSTSPSCSVVADGFTSIVDLNFASDGTAYVVEMDEASWFAVELGQAAGGTIDACDTSAAPWVCSEAASGLTVPFAVAVTASDRVFAAVGVLDPATAEVVEITTP